MMAMLALTVIAIPALVWLRLLYVFKAARAEENENGGNLMVILGSGTRYTPDFTRANSPSRRSYWRNGSDT